jgi:hypothetical protein
MPFRIDEEKNIDHLHVKFDLCIYCARTNPKRRPLIMATKGKKAGKKKAGKKKAAKKK